MMLARIYPQVVNLGIYLTTLMCIGLKSIDERASRKGLRITSCSKKESSPKKGPEDPPR